MSPPLKYKTPQEDRQNRMTSIIDEVLGSEYWSLTIDHFSIEENLLERCTKINCIVKMHDNAFNIQEVGKGPIDALFNGLRNNFKKSFLSFEGISFSSFSIEGDIAPASEDMSSEVECMLVIASDTNFKPLVYRHKDTSINRAAVITVLKAVEYYINSERAMKKLKFWAEDAKRRNRGDLYEQNIMKMSLLLEGASYSGSFIDKADDIEA